MSVVSNLEDSRRKRWLAFGVVVVLLLAGSLIVLRYVWSPSVDDNDPVITHRFQLWVDSRSYEFSIYFDTYPSESAAVDEINELRYFGLMYTVEVGDVDNHHDFYVFDLPQEIDSLWFRVYVVSDIHLPTDSVITELEMGVIETITVSDYEMSFLITPFYE